MSNQMLHDSSTVCAFHYEIFSKFSWTQPDGSTFIVTVSKADAHHVDSWYSGVRLGPYEIDISYVNQLLNLCSGEIIIEYKNQIIKCRRIEQL